ncbi:carbohydrate sulfotransferase 1-like [Phymastichus coffea]|uniref:carbohydrate sulfotransferase 1-like n=1 Tax=Phymastichus coffea TaxID=108790 RepID=UPI00273ABB84|nr:carbohydrate sulfotransferase 1-like [Phymastichus coffea]
MDGYPYSDLSGRNVRELSDLVMESEGKPLRSVIVSTWRSGSSFLGDLVDAHPASYYYFEPLLYLGIVQFRRPLPSPEPFNTLRSLFNCDFSNLGNFLKYRSTDKWHSDDYNRYLRKQCRRNKNTCHDPVFSTKFCSLFPFQVAKIVGLDLALMDSFLEDNDLGIKIVFLIRDPRGVLHSRKSLDWCRNTPNCLNPVSLCTNMLLDYATAMDFSTRFPESFKVLRYEDLVGNPQRISREIYSFYGMAFHNVAREFVNTHTRVSRGDEYSTFRNSSAVSFQWKEKLAFDEVNVIQENCYEAIQIWGYNLAFNGSHQKNFDPLRPLTTRNFNYFR